MSIYELNIKLKAEILIKNEEKRKYDRLSLEMNEYKKKYDQLSSELNNMYVINLERDRKISSIRAQIIDSKYRDDTKLDYNVAQQAITDWPASENKYLSAMTNIMAKGPLKGMIPLPPLDFKNAQKIIYHLIPHSDIIYFKLRKLQSVEYHYSLNISLRKDIPYLMDLINQTNLFKPGYRVCNCYCGRIRYYFMQKEGKYQYLDNGTIIDNEKYKVKPFERDYTPRNQRRCDGCVVQMATSQYLSHWVCNNPKCLKKLGYMQTVKPHNYYDCKCGES